MVFRPREGSEGWLRAKFVAIRCWRVDGEGQRQIGWLIGQRPTRGQGDWKYFWSNYGPETPLSTMVEYTHRHYWVEQFHEEAKSLLGWDQYQGRLWQCPVQHGFTVLRAARGHRMSFHRNTNLVILSYSFLVWLEWRQRQTESQRGRPRRAFSPSARQTTTFAGVHPSPDR